MPVIAVKKIKKSKVWRTCDTCNRAIANGESCVRVFGNAERGEPTYAVHQHESCCSRDVMYVLNR